jgi:leucyl/phenylalanyl-tRNA--protein transferase
MPVFSLDDAIIFPHPVLRDPDGLMAVGGDLTPQRLLLAYSWGIFPWYHGDQPILWWWLAPRLMVRPEEAHISRSLNRVLRQQRFRVTINQDFTGVIHNCRSIARKGQDSTWIMPEMVEAYVQLHEQGNAHSVEVYDDGELVGGIYGVARGKIFFGESMFSKKSNASKVAFIHLAKYLCEQGFNWIDCQQDTPHMRTLGGRLIEEEAFLSILRENLPFIQQP